MESFLKDGFWNNDSTEIKNSVIAFGTDKAPRINNMEGHKNG